MFSRSSSKTNGFPGASGGKEHRSRDQLGNLRELGILGSLSSDSRSLRSLSSFKRNKQQTKQPIQTDWDSGADQPSFPEKSKLAGLTITQLHYCAPAVPLGSPRASARVPRGRQLPTVLLLTRNPQTILSLLGLPALSPSELPRTVRSIP